MAPSDKSSIPSWQRATSLQGAEDVRADQPESQQPDVEIQAAQQVESRGTEEVVERKSVDAMESVREQAIKFLSDASITDAPRERKVAFLQSKGLESEIIELLLSSQEAQVSTAKTSTKTSSVVLQQAARDTPPIVTYPEFLVHAQEQPPLVTKTLLVNTAYATAGIYGTLYALSKYIINPMQHQLSEARHELFSHSAELLDAMNAKLSDLVSTVPPSRPGTSLRKDDETADDESITSDPTELFHRDMGTQTSPAISRRNSVSSSSTNASPALVVDQQASRLRSLTTLLSDLRISASARATTDSDVTNQLSELSTKLNEMAYTSSSYYKYNSSSSYNWVSGSDTGGGANPKDDEIELLKKDIKKLKGTFLGVRNFPKAAAAGAR